jgi:hypothetical protein
MTQAVSPLAKPAPANGDVVYIQGYEFIARDVRIVRSSEGGLCRFEAHCTDDARNDPIRNTPYDGATYGWRVS